MSINNTSHLIYGSFSEAAQIMWTFLAILFYYLKLGERMSTREGFLRKNIVAVSFF